MFAMLSFSYMISLQPIKCVYFSSNWSVYQMQSNAKTPSKQSWQQLQSIDYSYLTSSHKQQKAYIDRFGGVHRETFNPHSHFAPMLRVDLQPQKEEDNNINQRQELKEQLQKVLDRTIVESKEVQNINQEAQLKQHKILEILKKKMQLKAEGQQLRKLAILENELKQRIWRETEQRDNIKKQHFFQGHATQQFQQRQAFMIAHSFFLNTQNIEKIIQKVNEVQTQTVKLSQKVSELESVIADNNQKCKAKMSNMIQLKQELDKAVADSGASAIQISVLKMQTNSFLRVGFSTVSLDPENDRKRILEKTSNTWPRNKTRSMTPSEIKDFLVIQLYPSWRRMLNRMSSQFVGYQQLLCHQPVTRDAKPVDLTLFLPQKPQNNRNSGGKTKSFVVVFSPLESTKNEILKVITGLRGLSNGIITVQDVKIDDLENGQQEVHINYDYIGCPRLKKIELVWLKQLSRDTVKRYLPIKEDKTVLLKIEVPLIPDSSTQKSQYEEVYDMIRRWK